MDVRIAWRSLVEHRKRTAFLSIAIGTVTALLVLMNALSAGIRESMVRTATTLFTGDLNVGGFYKVTAGMGAPLVTDYRKIMELVRKEVPEVTGMVARGRGWARLNSDTAGMQVGIGGIDIRSEPEFRARVRAVSGRIEDLEKPGTILLFQSQAKKLEAKVGDVLTFAAPTPKGTYNTIDVRVAAIAADMGLLSSWQVFIPEVSLAALYEVSPAATGAVHVFVKDRGDLKPIAARLRSVLEKNGYRLMPEDPNPFWMKFEKVSREDWTGQKLDVTTWEDELAFLTWILTILAVLTGMLIFVLLGIISVGIMNTMWIAIRERTREIGTLRAIGMHRLRVLRMFLTEALLLGALSTMAGAVGGLVVATLVNLAGVRVPEGVQLFLMNDTLWLYIQPGALLRAIVIITAVTTAAALFPAYRAARLKPVAAMSHVG